MVRKIARMYEPSTFEPLTIPCQKLALQDLYLLLSQTSQIQLL